jgi:hypothetical protein
MQRPDPGQRSDTDSAYRLQRPQVLTRAQTDRASSSRPAGEPRMDPEERLPSYRPAGRGAPGLERVEATSRRTVRATRDRDGSEPLAAVETVDRCAAVARRRIVKEDGRRLRFPVPPHRPRAARASCFAYRTARAMVVVTDVGGN